MAIRRNGPPNKPFCVVADDGSTIACHATEASARRQLAAIEAAKMARGDSGDEFVTRLDFSRLGRAERTPSGGVRVPAHLTRTGVFSYLRADGSHFRELRHPDEVFDGDSLSSLAGAPVTDLHPGQMVSASNWRDLSIGHVGEKVSKQDRFVHAQLFIQDEKAISAVERGDRQEISMGYTCRLDMTPGEYNGETYDAVQRTIRYNHAALGPSKWGRAGAEVSLHLDSVNHSIFPDLPETTKETTIMKTIRIDGRDYEIGSEAHIAKLDEMRSAEIATIQSKLDETEGRLAAETKRADELKGKLDSATSQTRVDALVATRVDLLNKAHQILGSDAKLDGLTDRAIMIRSLRKDEGNPFEEEDEEEKKDSRYSIDYIRGMFEHTAKSAQTQSNEDGGSGSGGAFDAARRAAETAGGNQPPVRTDGNNRQQRYKYDAKGARADVMDDTENAWKQPLSATK